METEPTQLEVIFFQHASRPGSGWAGMEALAAALQEALATARAAWPELAVEAPAFVGYLAARVPEGEEPVSAARAVHAADLYLACACVAGDRVALARFDRDFLSRVDRFVAGVDSSPAFADEVRQRLRERLLVGAPVRGAEEGAAAGAVSPARMADYSGRGALAGWLRVAALRLALNLRRDEGGHRLADIESERMEALAASSQPGPELLHLKARYHEEFAAAVRAALASLPAEQRALLRLYFIEGMSLEALGALYRVHLSTISRRLGRAREEVSRETCRILQERLGLSGSDFASVAQLVMSQLNLSISRLLG